MLALLLLLLLMMMMMMMMMMMIMMMIDNCGSFLGPIHFKLLHPPFDALRPTKFPFITIIDTARCGSAQTSAARSHGRPSQQAPFQAGSDSEYRPIVAPQPYARRRNKSDST